MPNFEALWGLSVIAGPVILGLALACAMFILPRRSKGGNSAPSAKGGKS